MNKWLGMLVALGAGTLGAAVSSGISFGTYEWFKSDDFGGGFVPGAKSGALVGFAGILILGVLSMLGMGATASWAKVFSGTAGMGALSGVGALQNALGSPVYMNGLGSPVYMNGLGALVATPTSGCLECTDW